jgi:thiol-disulfide isomerase/thioredoxin
MKPALRFGIAVSLAASLFAIGSAADLAPGMKAPALTISTWIKGQEVKSFEPGHIYVVEFWATWCGPCIEGMPHLSELQAKYKDKVTVIGVNAFERGGGEGVLANVKKFVKDQGDKMSYTVARDSEKAEMAANWMTAAGQNSIPTAFIVDQKGMVVWVGHPAMMDELLAQVIDGSFDLEKSKKDFAEQSAVNQKRIAMAKRMQELNKMYHDGKKEEAIKGLDEIAKDPAQKMNVDLAKVSLYVEDDFAKAETIIRDQMKADGEGNALNIFLFNFAMQVPEIKPADAPAYGKLMEDLVAHLVAHSPAGDAFVPLNLSNVLVNLKKYDEALAMAEKAMKLFEADPKKDESFRKYFEEQINSIKEAKTKAGG